MKLVAALGNPGARYARTRHNVGFRVAECFASRHGIAVSRDACESRLGEGRLPAADAGGESLEVAVLLPQTYMNRSGDAVALALQALGVGDVERDLVVVLDDVDLPFGRLRVRPGGGAGGHRGLAHIIERLGRRDFARLRFGIGRPEDDAQDTRDYVLEPFAEVEERALQGHLGRAADALEALLRLGPREAMNRFNRDPAADPDPAGPAGAGSAGSDPRPAP